MYLSGIEIAYFGKAHLGKAHLDLFNILIWGNPVCWVAQPSMEKLRGLFWGAWGSQLNQELSVAYDLMLPHLFTTSVFPLVFKVRFIFSPLV